MNQTIWYKEKPIIRSYESVVGPRESNGPLGEYFGIKLKEDKNNQETYELSESIMQMQAIRSAINKAKLCDDDIGTIISGDLVNELVVSSNAANKLDIPFLGVYNACSTFGEALLLGSSLISGRFMDNVVCSSSSHFSTVERQFRYPLELGTQPTPTSQWTVTGAGCTLLSNSGEGPKIDCATIGKVIDMGVNDANNMGAAMAPAAVDTMISHLKDTGRKIDYYDYIYTGDLGKFGKTLFIDLMAKNGYVIGDNYNDCGAIIYNDKKSVQGGSGAGCANVVFNSYLIKLLQDKKDGKLLLLTTGALLSKLSNLQGQTIPCIAHCVAIES